MGSRSTYRSSCATSAAHGVTRPVVGQIVHVNIGCCVAGVPGAVVALRLGPGRCVCGGMWPAREPSVPRVVLVARWCSGRRRPGRPRDRHTRACGSEWSISKPARALRFLRRLHTRGAWALMCGSARRLVGRPCPATAHRHRDRAPRGWPAHFLRALRHPQQWWDDSSS